MKIWLLGSDGMLAFAIKKVLHANELLETDRSVDISSFDTLQAFAQRNLPELMINCAAFTNVDDAEKNIELTFKINAQGAKNLSKIANELNCPLIHFSTDYVFDGNKKSPYTEDDIPNPLQVYGKSKLAGDRAIMSAAKKYYILRASWLYGPNGNNFVKTIMSLSKKQSVIKIVADQVGSPTFTFDLANTVKNIIDLSPGFGLYNASNEGFCSWFEFAQEIVKLTKSRCIVEPVETAEFQRVAKRPKYSVLSKSKLHKKTGYKMSEWQTSLMSFISSYLKPED